MRFYAVVRGRRITAWILAPSAARARHLVGAAADDRVVELRVDQVDDELLALAGERSWREGELCAAGAEEVR